MISFPSPLRRLRDRWQAASDVRRGCFITAFCAVLFVAVNWRNYAVDTISQALVPVRLCRDGRLDLNAYRALYEDLKADGKGYSFAEANGHLYPRNSLFVSILVAPLYLPPVLAGVPTDAIRFWIAWGRLCAALGTGVAMGLLYLALRRRGSPAAALGIALLVAFGTSIWTAVGQSLYDHLGTVLCTSALAVVLRDVPLSPRRAALAAFLMGAAVGMRPTTVVLLFPIGVYLFFWPNVLAGWKARLAAVGGILIVPLANVLLNVSCFGHWNQTGYSAAESDRWTSPIWQGAIGQLLAPNVGLFVQSPFTLLAVVGAWAAWRTPGLKDRGVLLGYAFGFVCYWLMYSHWYAWDGGLGISGRLLCDGYPLWAGLALVGWNAIRDRRFAVILVAAAGAWAVLYHLVGISVFDRVSELKLPSSPWRPEDHFIVAHVKHSGLWATLRAVALTAALFCGVAVTTVYVLARVFLPEPTPVAQEHKRGV